MLKILGWSLLVVGGLLCLTIIFAVWGMPMAFLGALLLIADALYCRNRNDEASSKNIPAALREGQRFDDPRPIVFGAPRPWRSTTVGPEPTSQ